MIFVGECRSLTARRRGWTWKDGRLAAKPLFEALNAMGIDPSGHEYMNLWTDAIIPVVPWQRVTLLRTRRQDGIVIVALGRRVSDELARRDVDHVALVHPAARGRIRKRERYIAHVREKLSPHVAPTTTPTDREASPPRAATRPRRVMRITWIGDQPSAKGIEEYRIQVKNGWRLLESPTAGEAPMHADAFRGWFARLGVTHVEHRYGTSPREATADTSGDTLADGTYRVARWIRWCAHTEREQ